MQQAPLPADQPPLPPGEAAPPLPPSDDGAGPSGEPAPPLPPGADGAGPSGPSQEEMPALPPDEDEDEDPLVAAQRRREAEELARKQAAEFVPFDPLVDAALKVRRGRAPGRGAGRAAARPWRGLRGGACSGLVHRLAGRTLQEL